VIEEAVAEMDFLTTAPNVVVKRQAVHCGAGGGNLECIARRRAAHKINAATLMRMISSS
jgi:hypothetical protein